MKIASAFSIAVREIRGGAREFWILATCLAVGVGSIAAIGSVRAGIEGGLRSQGAVILGGDAEMTYKHRTAEGDELAWMQDVAKTVSEVLDFRSMATSGADRTALTRLKAVDADYPIYGSVTLEPDISLDDALAPSGGLPGAVMERSLATSLSVPVGGEFRLGRNRFRLTAYLIEEPDAAVGGVSFGPRSLVRSADLEGSGLIGPGSLFDAQYRLELPAASDLAAIADEAEQIFSDRGLVWVDKRNGAPGTQRFVERFGAFMLLVGLTGIVIGGVGVSAAVRTYLTSKTSVIATLKSVGAERSTILLSYLLQVGSVAMVGILLGSVAGGMAPVVAGKFLKGALDLPFSIGPDPYAIFQAVLYGFLVGLAFSLWSLAHSWSLPASALFRDPAEGRLQRPPAAFLAAIIAILAALVAIAAWLTDAVLLALGAAGMLVAAFVILGAAAIGAKSVAGRCARMPGLSGRTALRLALASIARPGGETASVVISMGLGLSALAIIGQISSNLTAVFETSIPQTAPDYVMVDIQPHQLEAVKSLAAEGHPQGNLDTVPMLRGFITRINGVPAREAAGDHWVFFGDRGVTFSDQPPPDMILTRGDWWPVDYQGPPLVSFAEEEAAEIGLEIGDELTVNILGRDIVARVSSLRRVDYRTFGSGFIMSMNPSALAGAPHTYVAASYSGGEVNERIPADIAARFPNVSVIRVKDSIERAAAIAADLKTATSYGAATALLAGIAVLIGAAAAGERSRIYEAAILKTLGASRRRILLSFSFRYMLLGLIAGAVAAVVGAAVAFSAMTFLLDANYRFNAGSAAATTLAGIAASLGAGLLFSFGPLQARPAALLRERN